jgi:hypothetical protein
VETFGYDGKCPIATVLSVSSAPKRNSHSFVVYRFIEEITEKPKLDDVEEWVIYNFSGDAVPRNCRLAGYRRRVVTHHVH